MKHLAFGLVGLSLVTGIMSALAAPSSLVAFDSATRALLKSGDPARGEKYAKEADCASCHGLEGTDDAPLLEGMRDAYIFKQMMDFRAEKRDGSNMSEFVDGKSDQYLADLSAWYASVKARPWTPPSSTPASIRNLVLKGDPKRMIKACAACHGRLGNGGQYDHPKLSGQKKEAFVASLEAFREGERTNDIYSRMRVIAKELTDAEIEGLATYYAGAGAPE